MTEGLTRDMQTLAAIAAAKAALVKQEKAVKARLLGEVRRGSVAVPGLDGTELGMVVVPAPSRTIAVSIADEELVFPWAVDLFGPGIVESRLTEQGRLSVEQAAKAEHKLAGSPDVWEGVAEGLPGVVVTVRTSSPSVSFRPAADVDLLGQVRALAAAGDIDLLGLLGVEEGGGDA